MDAKVKSMIKLIEEDADSFARRAEMYYKKRPELMKLVEEFYRAYRALAERYDHATGVIRHAHRTMTEAFPNQVPLMLDDSPANSATGDPRTPDSTVRAFFDPDDLHKDVLEFSAHSDDAKRNGVSSEESDSIMRRKGLKQLADLSESGNHAKFAEGKVRKGLKFHEASDIKQGLQNNENQPEQVDNSKEILTLKETLAKVEAEREAGLIQYQQSLEKLSVLESEISRAQEHSKGLCERATKAEAEVETLKEALAKLETEKEANLQEYRGCLNRISSLESTLSHAQGDSEELKQKVCKAETDAQSLKDELATVLVEKDVALDQYMGSLEMISNLEHKLQCSEEDAKMLKQRAEKAENEVENLKQAISKLAEEKEAAEIQYRQCLETISILERNLSTAQEETQRLNIEIENGVANLKGAEERCLLLEKSNQSLHSELESLILKMGNQSQELTEKQKELGRLWACVQEERLRFVEAETAFQTLQHLHAQAQEELRSLATELHGKVQNLKEVETRNKSLQDEVLQVKDENKSLDDRNVTSAITIKDLQNEMSNLREAKEKLEEEVEVRVDERNALQQEIYCLKEELNDLSKKNSTIMEQVHAVGLNPECLGSSVKELQDENSSLKETCRKEKAEKIALLEKLVILEQLLEKNSILENSLSDLNAELEALREKIKALEESCRSLLEEKAVLTDEKVSLKAQLEAANENLEKLSEKNRVLENSLSDVHVEVQGLKTKSRCLEDSYQLLVDQKAALTSENDSLTSDLGNAQVKLENLEKKYADLAEKFSVLENEKLVSISKITELEISLEMQMREHAKFVQLNESQLVSLKSEMNLLQEGLEWTRTEFDRELDKAFESQTEIFILRTCAQDLEERNLCLWTEYQKLSDVSRSMEDTISELNQTNLGQKIEIESMSDETSTLRVRIFQLLKSLDIVVDHYCVERREQDQIDFNHILSKVGQTKKSFFKTEEENQQLSMENSVLVTILGQLKFETENLVEEKSMLDQEFRSRSEQFAVLQSEALLLHERNEELRSKVTEGGLKEEVLKTQILDLQEKLLESQGSYQDLQAQNTKSLEEKESLKTKLLLLEEKNQTLEEESSIYYKETLSLGFLTFLLRNCLAEKSMDLKALANELHDLHGTNDTIRQKLALTERMLEEMLIQKEMELKQVREEHEKAKLQEETSRSELQRLAEHAEMWEANSLEVFGELQTSNLCQILYEQKVRELSEACDFMKGELTSRDDNVKLLKERASILASENVGLNAELAAFGPAISSLRKCISSLEKCTYLQGKLEKPENRELEEAEHSSQSNINDNEDAIVPDPISNLQDMQNKVQSVEKEVTQTANLLVQENLNLHSELEAAMRQIAELKSESSLYRRNGKPTSEMDNGLLTKDIMLDQASESSSYGISKREQFEADNQLLESWEAADQDGIIDLNVSKANKMAYPCTDKKENFHRVKSLKKQKSDHPTSDALIEKELGIDKLEISTKSTEPLQEGNKRKVLERLNSDVQKLGNLQITVQDLKRKLDIIEKSKKGKSMDECDILKEQLEEAEAAISKLFDLNGKLTKNVEGTPLSSSHAKSSMEPDENGSVRRRRISEQARRVSERIGRLQMEVQKIQFVLLKLDDGGNDGKGKTKLSESKRRVLLRDYLYGGGIRSSNRRKKAPFCSCVQPATRD